MKNKTIRLRPARLLPGFVHHLSQIVHITAGYLGIVVLVVLICALVLAPVRDQLRQAGSAALQALSPAAQTHAWAAVTRPAQDGAPGRAAHVAAPLPPATEAPVAPADQDFTAADILSDIAPGDTVALEDLRRDFGRILDENPDALAITGVSSAQFQDLRRYLARRYRVAHNVASALIQTAYALGRSQGVDPPLLLAIIAIESRYNPYAESHVGAQGLMQVMPYVHRDKFDALGLDISAALEPVPNMMVGTKIYTDCRKRRGSIAGALSCYVGATGSDGGYGARVLSERRRIERAARIIAQAD